MLLRSINNYNLKFTRTLAFKLFNYSAWAYYHDRTVWPIFNSVENTVSFNYLMKFVRFRQLNWIVPQKLYEKMWYIYKTKLWPFIACAVQYSYVLQSLILLSTRSRTMYSKKHNKNSIFQLFLYLLSLSLCSNTFCATKAHF